MLWAPFSGVKALCRGSHGFFSPVDQRPLLGLLTYGGVLWTPRAADFGQALQTARRRLGGALGALFAGSQPSAAWLFFCAACFTGPR